jgi:hypothetical protein
MENICRFLRTRKVFLLPKRAISFRQFTIHH